MADLETIAAQNLEILHRLRDIEARLDAAGIFAIPEVQPEEAAAPVAKPHRGQHITFGVYKGAPLQWVVLKAEAEAEPPRALIISRNVIDFVAYEESGLDTTWADCSLRKWLNNGFMETALSPDERARVVRVEIENGDNDDLIEISGGDVTVDQVFCLSIQEAKDLFLSEADRSAVLSPAVIAETGAESGAARWWLRSPGYFQDHAAIVEPDGLIRSIGEDGNCPTIGIRPALWMTL